MGSPEHNRTFTARIRPTQSVTSGRTLKPLKIRKHTNPLAGCQTLLPLCDGRGQGRRFLWISATSISRNHPPPITVAHFSGPMLVGANVVQSGACTTPRRPPWRSSIPNPRSRPGRAQQSRQTLTRKKTKEVTPGPHHHPPLPH
eukprot:896318-Pleurochrysis_carterae.AAC.2